MFMKEESRASFMGVPMKHVSLITASRHSEICVVSANLCTAHISELGPHSRKPTTMNCEVGITIDNAADYALQSNNALSGRPTIFHLDGSFSQ